VFPVRPLPAGDRLTALPNVMMSARNAFRTCEASDKLIRIALDIVRVVTRDATCLWRVTTGGAKCVALWPSSRSCNSVVEPAQ
jgi:phosphoglycerate dehydrogenase-like enzyme